jgi:hypothetical protein
MFAEQPAPILRATHGTPVFTCDDQKVGTVKEIHGQYLQVSTPLFQRDFWLHADALASAVPDDRVLLAMDREQLDRWKIRERPSQAA